MKRIFILLITATIIFNICGCKTQKSETQHETVRINLPTDNTVNGYREQNFIPSKNPESISGSSVVVGAPLETNQNKNIQYCANINTKVFHLPDCSSAKKIKDDNKLLLSNRQTLIDDGYKPCNRCKP